MCLSNIEAGKFNINTVNCNSVLRVTCPSCFVLVFMLFVVPFFSLFICFFLVLFIISKIVYYIFNISVHINIRYKKYLY